MNQASRGGREKSLRRAVYIKHPPQVARVARQKKEYACGRARVPLPRPRARCARLSRSLCCMC